MCVAEYIFTTPPDITKLKCTELSSGAITYFRLLHLVPFIVRPTLTPNRPFYATIFCASERVTVDLSRLPVVCRCQGFEWGGDNSSTAGNNRKRPIYRRVVSSSRSTNITIIIIIMLWCSSYVIPVPVYVAIDSNDRPDGGGDNGRGSISRLMKLDGVVWVEKGSNFSMNEAFMGNHLWVRGG